MKIAVLLMYNKTAENNFLDYEEKTKYETSGSTFCWGLWLFEQTNLF